MRKLHFTYKTNLVFGGEVTRHCFTLRCIPADDSIQKICSYELKLDPAEYYQINRDCFGNRTCIGRCNAPHRTFSFAVEGIAFVHTANRQPEALHPIFRYPSEYTRVDPALESFYRSVRPKTGDPLSRACALMEAIGDVMSYTPGITDVSTTAAGAFALRQGVCQDYAHLLIALCRLDGIPARYAAGMIHGEGLTHGWTEIYDGSCWIGLDPTHSKMADDHLIKLCHGRDYADCAVVRGIFYGNFQQEQSVRVVVEDCSEW